MRPPILNIDEAKSTLFSVLFHKGNWLQTPVKTLTETGGQGVCGDYAIMNYETLLRTGFDASEVDLLGGSTDAGYHTVAIVRLDGTPYVVDNAPAKKRVVSERINHTGSSIHRVGLTHLQIDYDLLPLQYYMSGYFNYQKVSENHDGKKWVKNPDGDLFHIVYRDKVFPFVPQFVFGNRGFADYNPVRDGGDTRKLENSDRQIAYHDFETLKKNNPALFEQINENIKAISLKPNVSLKNLMPLLVSRFDEPDPLRAKNGQLTSAKIFPQFASPR